VATGFLLGWLATALLKDHHFAGPQWSIFAADTAAFLLFLFVALKSGRYWPLFAAAFQLLAVVTHVASTFDRHLSAWAYITAGVIWSYLLLGSIGLGAWNTWRGGQLAPSGIPTGEPGATLR
jgi:hypothetical protein